MKTRRAARLARAIAFAGLAGAAPAMADPYQVGDRWFPATPLTDDPFVADAAYSLFSHLRQAGSPNFGFNDWEIGFEKRITDRLGVSFAENYEVATPLGQSNLYGWDNPYARLKYQAFEDPVHETIVSLGFSREFGGTGAARVGAENVGLNTPTLYAAKGFGDLPDDLKFLRPFAVTGTFGIQIPDARLHNGEANADMAEAGFSLQYSLHYLQGNVEYAGLPDFFDRLIPIVEVSYSAPVSSALGNPTTAIVAPGIVYSNNGLDVSVEALLPVNRASGIGVGGIAKLHVPFGRIADVLSKPLLGD